MADCANDSELTQVSVKSANLNRYKTRNASYYNRILVKDISTLLPFSMIYRLTTDYPLWLYSLPEAEGRFGLVAMFVHIDREW